MGRFSVIAWTDNPERIARELLVGIPEPPTPYDTSEDDLRVPREAMVPVAVSVLDYPVVVHLLRVADMEAFTDVSSEGGSTSGDSNDPERDPGGGPSPRQPRTHSFACQRGVVDGEFGGSGTAHGGQAGFWRRAGLPPVVQVAPWPSARSNAFDVAVVCSSPPQVDVPDSGSDPMMLEAGIRPLVIYSSRNVAARQVLTLPDPEVAMFTCCSRRRPFRSALRWMWAPLSHSPPWVWMSRLLPSRRWTLFV